VLEAAEIYQNAFDKLEGEDSIYLGWFGECGPPSNLDWDNVRASVSFLKIFYEATKVFSSSQQVSLHATFHQLTLTVIELNDACMNLNTIVADVWIDMKVKYDKYWVKIEKINQILYCGVVLDPRYMLRYMDWSFNEMYVSNRMFAKKLSGFVKSNLFKMFAKKVVNFKNG